MDCGSEKHQACVIDACGSIVNEMKVEHSGPGLSSLIAWINETAPASNENVAVPIKAPHGPVVDALVERGFAVFSINPKQLDRFRDRHSVARAKDDSRDAFVLAESVRTDAQCFRRVHLASDFILEIRELSRLEDDLHQEHTPACNQLRELLNRYFPQILQLSPAADDAWVWELLRAAPLPARAAKLTQTRIGSLLERFRIRRLTAEEGSSCVEGSTSVRACGHRAGCERASASDC